MIPRLNTEISDALSQASGPLEVQDAGGSRNYVILSDEAYRALRERELRDWLQTGLDQEAAGDAQPWNLQELFAEARQHV